MLRHSIIYPPNLFFFSNSNTIKQCVVIFWLYVPYFVQFSNLSPLDMFHSFHNMFLFILFLSLRLTIVMFYYSVLESTLWFRSWSLILLWIDQFSRGPTNQYNKKKFAYHDICLFIVWSHRIPDRKTHIQDLHKTSLKVIFCFFLL